MAMVRGREVSAIWWSLVVLRFAYFLGVIGVFLPHLWAFLGIIYMINMLFMCSSPFVGFWATEAISVVVSSLLFTSSIHFGDDSSSRLPLSERIETTNRAHYPSRTFV